MIGRASLPAIVAGSRPRRLGSADTRSAIALLLPAIAALIVLRLIPAFGSLAESVQVGREGELGLENFAFLLSSGEFLASVRTTLVFAVIVNPLQILLALGFAVLLVQKIPLAGLWRTLVFLPIAVPQAVSALLWGAAFRPDGPLNEVITALGLAGQPFLSSSVQALPSLIILVSWVGVGYWMMLLIAGLLEIPKAYYEAAAIDGAGPIRSFRHITLPLLRRPLAFVLVADTVANFLVFAPVNILTRGGPEGSTNLIMYEIYRQAFIRGDRTLAAAETVILLAILVVIVGIEYRLLTRGANE